MEGADVAVSLWGWIGTWAGHHGLPGRVKSIIVNAATSVSSRQHLVVVVQLGLELQLTEKFIRTH